MYFNHVTLQLSVIYLSMTIKNSWKSHFSGSVSLDQKQTNVVEQVSFRDLFYKLLILSFATCLKTSEAGGRAWMAEESHTKCTPSQLWHRWSDIVFHYKFLKDVKITMPERILVIIYLSLASSTDAKSLILN